jgi:RND family efflux transporter MFP subunit
MFPMSARRRLPLCLAALALGVGLAACGSVDVVVARAGPASLIAQSGGVGTVQAAVTIPVSVDVRDNITNVDVQPGDHVTQGQPLFDLDPSALQAAQAQLALRLQSISASIASAQAGLIVDKQKGSADVPAVMAEIADLQAEAAVEQQLINISKGKSPTVTAPAAGDVSSVLAAPGLQATPGEALVTIIDYSNINVTASLPIAEQGQVKVGQSATLTFPSLPGVTVQGQVTSVSPSATTNGVSFQATVAAPNTPDKAVRPNLQAYVRISATQQAAVAVPKVAVLNIDFNPTVFVVSGDVAHLRQVRIGIADQNKVEILSGLRPGDMCVVVGNQSLQDGSRVRVTSSTS